MNPTERPDPDQLLARLEREENQARRGRLKIFFGATAGVGKTFAMLKAGQIHRTEGRDVVVGLVETHGRKETAELLAGLEILPVRLVDYRGKKLSEFDLDGTLERQPDLVLVDELAHNNAPGSRHTKRWQDIEELLDAGINVYTTLNVQHLESLNDDIGHIAGVKVRETVPDSVFENATEVALVDLPPDELLERLKEGKVYLPEQAQLAARSFFRKGNLIALRELALRQTAQRVDQEMLDYREDHAIRDVWQVGELILVCIAPDAMAERLVRAGKRFAVGLRAPWIVVYVETPHHQRISAEKREKVLKMLRLAEQLGAETINISALDLKEAILQLASQRNVSKIVMGKPRRRGWRRWLLGSVVDSIIAEAHNINIYLLGSPESDQQPDKTRSRATTPRHDQANTLIQAKRYGYSVALILLSTLIAHLMFHRLQLTNLVMIYLMAIVISATRFGRGPSILASILSVATFDFLFIPPYFSFSVADFQFVITLGAMLTVALVVSQVMASARYQVKIGELRENRIKTAFTLSKELSACRSESECANRLVRQIEAEFGGHAAILFPDATGRMLETFIAKAADDTDFFDMGVAQWVYDHEEMAGQGTNSLAGAKAVYLPMLAGEHIVGVMALVPDNLETIFMPESRKQLDTFIDLAAEAIYRVRLEHESHTARLQAESERLRSALLSSISHDLRAPLAHLIDSAKHLGIPESHLTEAEQNTLGQVIHDESLHLAGLVNNIIEMARLDSGSFTLNPEPHKLEDIIEAARSHLQKKLKGRRLMVRIPQGLPLLQVDAVMMEQVVINLLENAIHDSPPEAAIDIQAEQTQTSMIVSIADHGPGIPKGQEERVFDKFHRREDQTTPIGMGLGLSISRAIIEAHSGSIKATNRQTGGSIYSFELPLGGGIPDKV